MEHVIREFIVEVDCHVLNITFTPSSDHSNAYAFVNKIEVMPMPRNLYIRDVRLPLIGNPSQFYAYNRTALETMYRVNIGGQTIPPEHDTGMLRLWSRDEGFLMPSRTSMAIHSSKVKISYSPEVPEYTAPVKVYSTARTSIPYGSTTPQGDLSWSFPVSSGFCYLIRFHFCEITRGIIQNERVFQVYVNKATAENQADIMKWSGMPGRPVYRDYIINSSFTSTSLRDTQETGLEYLEITIHSNASPRFYDQGILNGLEIFKLPDSTGNFAGLYPFGSNTSQSSLHNNQTIFRIVLFIVCGIPALISLCFCILYIPSRWFSFFSRFRNQSPKPCRPHWENVISLTKIKSATNNFSEAVLVGTGGFGKVYRGWLDGEARAVAIKRADSSSHQGLHEFQTEISLLSKLRHHHLVSLIGYCFEKKEMILIYNFMARGTLREHLYKTKNPPLPWKKRLKICIGAARGLHYLHTGSKQIVIHRDVKSSNILLDKRWEAKVSDFGLSKLGPDAMNQCDMHVSTKVKGSIGYLDPEYYRCLKLTAKSDVYSFGVVLFEVLCAKPAIVPAHGNEDGPQSLAEWALKCYHSGMLGQIMDPYLQGKIDPGCFKTFTDVAVKCLAETGRERPPMGDVLWNLELALQQQSRADGEKPCGPANKVLAGDASILAAHQLYNSDKNIGAEFSEIIHPSAR
ncbi:hypothetical protein NL676_032239 [Syzygium grande]|nr:hypothetical protein NL676_032239 [Syzygium grande]